MILDQNSVQKISKYVQLNTVPTTKLLGFAIFSESFEKF